MNGRWEFTTCPICGHAITMGPDWNHENDCPWGMALVHIYESDVYALAAEARMKELESAQEALEWLHAAHMNHPLTAEDAWEALRRGLIAPREKKLVAGRLLRGEDGR